MYIPEKKPLFRKPPRESNPYRIAVMLGILMMMLLVLRNLNSGKMTPLFLPTATPTRTVDSFAQEGETYFVAGDLEKAMEAYKQAVALDPANIELRDELARIQVYSTTLLTIDAEKIERFNEALATVNEAIAIAPENSNAHAIKAFALDWMSDPNIAAGDRDSLLTEAEQEAVQALQLDSTNTLALAYYAEILVDEQKWVQAESNISEAVDRDPESMDVRRINGYMLESIGNYSQAISEYQEAIRINPNLTFIYLRIGANYRTLQNYDMALEYFDKAATINNQLGVQDSVPYFSIATTYTQMGEFLVASTNALKGLNFDPGNADMYGRLGIVYHKSRNYEGAIPAFKCALEGCNAEESCEVRQCNSETDEMIEVEGLPLSNSTVDYYLTYGSVLAGMHRTVNGYCEDAMRVLKMVREAYGNDATVMSTLNESVAICNSYGYR
jgi:tetratricopeptide (TPR) repeat protein